MSARTIYTQGDLDGACFLYALANAYRALTGSEAKLERFGACVQALDHATDFFYTGTTDHYEGDPALLLRAATGLLAALDEGGALRVEPCPEVCAREDLAALIGPNAVAVFRYMGSARYAANADHWVCAVAAEGAPPLLYVACSIRYSDATREGGAAYAERAHAPLGRRSNDEIGCDHSAKIVAGSVLRIARVARPQLARSG